MTSRRAEHSIFNSLPRWQHLLLPAAAILGLALVSKLNFLLFHTLVEFFAISVSFLMFAIAWKTYGYSKNQFFIYLACGYLWIGLLDGFHALFYEGLTLFESAGGSLSSSIWICTRFFEALLLCTAPSFIYRNVRKELLLPAFGVVAISAGYVVYSGYFPESFIEGTGLTAFKINSEYVIIGILGLAIANIIRYRRELPVEEHTLIVVAIGFTILAEISFTQYGSVFGFPNFLGHIFKLLSYWLLYKAVVVHSLTAPYLALEESEIRLKAIMEGSPDIAAVVQEGGQITFITPSVKEVLGYEREDVVKGNLLNFIDDELRDLGREALNGGNGTGNGIHILQGRIRHADGKPRMMEVRLRDMRQDPRVAGYIATARDLTPQLKAFEDLRISESKLRAAQDIADLGLWSLDLESGTLDWPFEYNESYGISVEEVGGSLDTYLSSIHKDDIGDVIATLGEVSSGKMEVSEVTYRTVLPSGERRNVLVVGKGIKDQDGKVVRIEGIAQDTTRQFETIRRLQESEARLKRAQDVANCGYWSLDIKTGLFHCADKFTKMMGRAPGDNAVLLQTLKDHIPEEDIPACWDAFNNTIDNGVELDLEHRIVSVTGETAWIRQRGELQYDDDGLPTVIEGMSLDITSQKSVEHWLMEARKDAEDANRAKSEFLANMSHELRTPMNGILGMADLLSSYDVSEDALDKVSVIKESGEHLLGLLNDILDISKVETGKANFESVEFGLADLVATHAQFVAVQAEEKGIEFELNSDGIEFPTLVGDPTRVRQVIGNLTNNAVKFTERGLVSLTISQVNIGDGSVETKFEVVDTGIGIPEDKLELVFGRFVQADSSTTRRYGGSGLGLYISKQLAKSMGGKIGVEANPEGGSRFWFTIANRLARSGSKTAPVKIGSDDIVENMPEDRPLRILVAEDNLINQKVIEVLLRKLGHETVLVSNGLEAVSEVVRSPFDIVFMDIQMPDLDGIGAMHAIRDVGGEYCNIPIIAITANAMMGDREKYLGKGMSDYVSKPVKLETLKAAIDRQLGAVQAMVKSRTDGQVANTLSQGPKPVIEESPSKKSAGQA